MRISQVPSLQQPMLRFLLVLTVASTVGLQGWRTLFNNFAVEVAHLGGQHIGVIQSVREIPGFLALLAVWVMLFIQEHRLSALSVVVMGVGVALTGFYPSYLGLTMTTLVMSFGFHYYETVNQSLTLQYFDKQTAPLVFGAMRSVSALTNVAVGVAVFLLASVTDYRNMYLLLGGIIAVMGIWGLRQEPVDRTLAPQHKHMVFRRRYALFYFLTFMSGARRQVFAVFSVFLLVKVFAFSIQEVTVLFVVNNVIGYFAGPWAGKAIVRYGERAVLSVEYSGLIAVFLAYALTSSKWVVAVLYLADHLLFNCSIAIRTFFQKVGDRPDIAPSMAVGFTINHIAAVVLPALGGALWALDYRIPFVFAAGLSAISLLAVQRIPGALAAAHGMEPGQP